MVVLIPTPIQQTITGIITMVGTVDLQLIQITTIIQTATAITIVITGMMIAQTGM